MIEHLCGNENSVKAFTASLNKPIAGIKIDRYELVLTFEDGTALTFTDQGQSCCESRYMVCDDDLQNFIGSTFTGAELLDGPRQPDDYGEHEVQFLHIATTRGKFTVSNHNEHNGYYGGFAIRCS